MPTFGDGTVGGRVLEGFSKKQKLNIFYSKHANCILQQIFNSNLPNSYI
jgi:hypothetical protein